MSYVEEAMAKRQAAFDTLRRECPDLDDLPFDNSDPRVRLSQGDDGRRYNVYFMGQKIGWICRPIEGVSDPRLAEWTAYLVDPRSLSKGMGIRADGSKRRNALADMLYEAWKRGRSGT